MALSHCWGFTPTLCLTTTNIDRLRSRFQVTSLLTSSQDAVIVSQRLQIRFLWIEFLCILQDSVEDWRRESARMGDVYRNAICCIATTAALNGEGSLFRDRERSQVKMSLLQSSWFGQTNQLCEVVDEQLWDLNIDRAPLLRRGWVVQECVLAPRVIHFGKNQLFWECGEQSASKFYPEGLPYILNDTIDTKRSFNTMKPDLVPVDWSQLIKYYPHCALTRQEDKLITISGLAKVF